MKKNLSLCTKIFISYYFKMIKIEFSLCYSPSSQPILMNLVFVTFGLGLIQRNRSHKELLLLF